MEIQQPCRGSLIAQRNQLKKRFRLVLTLASRRHDFPPVDAPVPSQVRNEFSLGHESDAGQVM